MRNQKVAMADCVYALHLAQCELVPDTERERGGTRTQDRGTRLDAAQQHRMPVNPLPSAVLSVCPWLGVLVLELQTELDLPRRCYRRGDAAKVRSHRAGGICKCRQP